MVQNDNAGASGTSLYPDISDEDLLKKVKSSEAYKTFMEPFKDLKELDDKSEEEDEDVWGEDSEAMDDTGKNKINTTLHKLKEKSGFPYFLCKRALDENNNDFEKAEEWLEKEGKELGLEKLKKINDRKSTEGLVGVAWDKHHAAMVEVNSETDFVSSNEMFHELVDLVANTCLQHTKQKNPAPKTLSRVMLKGDEVGNLVAEDKQSLSDHLAKTIGQLGERLRLRRAALISTEQSARVAVLTHGADSSEYKNHGRMGTVLVYKADDYSDYSLQSAKHICQQIIGMKPQSLEPTEGGSQDTALLTQRYVRDTSQTVGDFAARAGLRIEDFVRFERGEPGDDPDELGTEPAKPLC